jgi:hypothetical protein
VRGATSSCTLAVGARGTGGKRERIMFQGFSRLISRSYSITEAEWSSSRAGCSWRFRLAPKRSSLLRELGITYHIEETTVAVQHYNELAQTQPVGGLFHWTC